MTDKSIGDRHGAPDFVPEALVAEFGDEARVVVLTDRCLRDIVAGDTAQARFKRMWPKIRLGILIGLGALGAASVATGWLLVMSPATSTVGAARLAGATVASALACGGLARVALPRLRKKIVSLLDSPRSESRQP